MAEGLHVATSEYVPDKRITQCIIRFHMLAAILYSMLDAMEFSPEIPQKDFFTCKIK